MVQSATQSSQLPENKAEMVFLEVDISEEDLVSRATFPILWPTYLPDGFPFQRAGAFDFKNEGLAEVTDAVLHFGSDKEHWLMLTQRQSIQHVSPGNFQPVAQLKVAGKEVTVYEQVKGGDNVFVSLYFDYDGTTTFVRAVGMAKEDMLKVVSGLEIK